MFKPGLIGQWLLMLLLLYSPTLLADNTVTVALTDTISQTYTCNLEGKVIKVSDGDTITVLDSGKTQYKVRLAGIDAPEKKQDFGNAARKALAGKIAGQEVCVAWHKKDKYRRLVGNVLYDGQSVNLQMVQEGFAWHYKKYANEQTSEEQEVFAATEKNARLAVIGLWSQPVQYHRGIGGMESNKPAHLRFTPSQSAPATSSLARRGRVGNSPAGRNVFASTWTPARKPCSICSSAACRGWTRMGMVCRVRVCANDDALAVHGLPGRWDTDRLFILPAQVILTHPNQQ